MLGTPLEQMDIAYRMSAEIADWLNAHAARTGIDSVRLVGIRPNGIAVVDAPGTDAEMHRARLAELRENVALIERSDVWSHKGVEYDGVVVDTAGLSARGVSRSVVTHELVIV